MPELVVNLHLHTTYSDGSGTHSDIAKAAINAGLDAVIITDHNIWTQGLEGYYGEDDEKVLVLVGEEVHDQTRTPQKNHLLIFGANKELSTLAPDPQTLVSRTIEAGGVAFLAHPIDPEAPNFNQADLSWVDWGVEGYTGIELWNAMTEFKSLLKNNLHAIFYAFNFSRVATGPFPETLKKWDELLKEGRRVVAVGGADAHEFNEKLGPIKRVLFPYEKHFQAVNTHLLIPEPLSGDTAGDKRLILDALKAGHAFIGYDLPVSTKGFRFTAHQAEKDAIMGDVVSSKQSTTLQVKLPQPGEAYLLKDGEIIGSTKKRGTIVHKVQEPGVYRVEAYRHFKGKRRGWIFSNPIYVR